MPLRPLLLILALAGAILAGSGPAADAKVPAKARLAAFDSCGKLIRYARHHAIRTMRAHRDPYGPSAVTEGGGGAGGGAGADGSRPVPAATAPQAGVDFSGTNVQEEGVDEPDELKTDGRHVFAVVGGKVHAVDVRAGGARAVDALELEGYGHQLLLIGERLLVLSQGSLRAPGDNTGRGGSGGSDMTSMPGPGGFRPAVILTEVSVADPADLRVLNSMRVDGQLVGARAHDGSVRAVISSSPSALSHGRPPAGGDAVAERRKRIASARSSGWRPAAVVTRRPRSRARKTTVGPAVACHDVRRAPVFGGLDMLTVLTIDARRGLPEVDSDALLTTAETMYASNRSLYVATQRWLPETADVEDVPPGVRTAIHRFDISSRDETRYRASGEVRGYLLNQFSLSEHDGVLRAATTTIPVWLGDTRATESESFVTTLAERDGRLAQLDRVGGLGRDERIYAVRFMGPAGYVVTFRETDPLYYIDLDDPARIRVRGELKILGYSAYLHPIGDDLLVGVGQDATEEGRRRGAQVSLFDVSNPDDLRRIHQRALGDESSSSGIEWDHRAFLYWPATRLLVVPLEDWNDEDKGPPFFGALGFHVSRTDGFADAGRIQHEDDEEPWRGRIRRSAVIGDRVVTLSDRGLAAHTLDGLQPQAFVALD